MKCAKQLWKQIFILLTCAIPIYFFIQKERYEEIRIIENWNWKNHCFIIMDGKETIILFLFLIGIEINFLF
jgi:uncharacterized membrane protein